VCGGGLAAHKVRNLGVPFWIGERVEEWMVEARVSLLALDREVKVRLSLPSIAIESGTGQEAGSLGYNYFIEKERGEFTAVWSSGMRQGSQALYFRVRFLPGSVGTDGPLTVQGPPPQAESPGLSGALGEAAEVAVMKAVVPLAIAREAMAEGGVDVFYRGWVADSIDADMRRVGGFITRPELEAYEALPAILIEGTYRDHTLLGTFRPASGHSVIQSLQIFEAATPDGVSGAGQATDEARWMALLGQSMEIGIRERNRVEDSEEASAAFLTSLDRAREHAQTLIDPAVMEVTGAAASLAASHALVRAGTRVGLGSYLADPHDRESTTHLTAMDQDGRIISLTLSLGPSMGARIVAPGLGFLYATRLGNEPGSRPSSTIAPTLVLRPDGDLLAGLGGAGDARIISAVIQTIARMVDHEMPLDEAVAAPRIHPEGPRHLRAETGGASLWRPDALGRFVGWEFQLTETPSSYFGRVHAIGWDPVTRQVLAVAEPRWDGGVSAPTLAPVSP
jgi:gamma-glutamyltranspeptidase/glutathione hydrolase